jgi:alkaline phosphatase
MGTGVKTNNGVIGMDPDGLLLATILEMAQDRDYAVGLVTNVQISHATPAAFAAHVPDRNQMTDIALQMIEHYPNVLLGGGEDEFLPSTELGCFPQSGERTDGRNLINEAIAYGYAYVCNTTDFNAVNPLTTPYLLGIFADEGMSRPYSPSLVDMTDKAISILSQDPDGFFLMVEGGQIDWAAHSNDAANVISDTIGFDSAVDIGLSYASTHANTLLIVTADHETGGMSASLTSSGLPDEDGPFYMPDNTPFYINWTTGGHTGVDVPTTAYGYLSEQLSGTYENTHIFTVLRGALGWEFWIPIINK